MTVACQESIAFPTSSVHAHAVPGQLKPALLAAPSTRLFEVLRLRLSFEQRRPTQLKGLQGHGKPRVAVSNMGVLEASPQTRSHVPTNCSAGVLIRQYAARGPHAPFCHDVQSVGAEVLPLPPHLEQDARVGLCDPDHRLQHAPRVFSAGDIPLPEHSPFDVAILIEAEQRVIAGASDPCWLPYVGLSELSTSRMILLCGLCVQMRSIYFPGKLKGSSAASWSSFVLRRRLRTIIVARASG